MSKNKGEKNQESLKLQTLSIRWFIKKWNCLAAGKETEEKQTGKENIERLKRTNESERNQELVSS